MDEFFREFLDSKDVPQHTPKEREIAANGKVSAYEALLKLLCQRENPSQEMTSILFGLITSGNPSEYWESVLGTIKANSVWEKYSKREKQVFESSFGFSAEGLSTSQKQLYGQVREVIFRCVHAEQALNKTPFYSIAGKKGEQNPDFWIDRLNASSRAKKEQPFKVYRRLENLTDCDVVILNTTEPEDEERKRQDTIRCESGGIAKPFCQGVLKQMHDLSEEVKRAAAGPDDPLESIFLRGQASLDERFMVLQDQACQTLANLHFVHGAASRIITQINAASKPITTPRKAMIQTGELAKKQADHAAAIKELRFDQTCEEMEHALSKGVTIGAMDEEVVELIRIYATSLKSTSEELNRLGSILLMFTSGLFSSEITRPFSKINTGLAAIPSSGTAAVVRGGSIKALKKTVRTPLTTRPRSITMGSIAAPPPLVANMNLQNLENVGKLMQAAQKIFREIAEKIESALPL